MHGSVANTHTHACIKRFVILSNVKRQKTKSHAIILTSELKFANLVLLQMLHCAPLPTHIVLNVFLFNIEVLGWMSADVNIHICFGADEKRNHASKCVHSFLNCCWNALLKCDMDIEWNGFLFKYLCGIWKSHNLHSLDKSIIIDALKYDKIVSLWEI